jgi:hypothetical protein
MIAIVLTRVENPIITLLEPVVIALPESLPITVLLSPPCIDCNDWNPMLL